ncbi:MAG TPA: hypothetical protein VNM90_24930 [Haliangium sp.]|nr:hypothetical protein [Haliangium sp.]
MLRLPKFQQRHRGFCRGGKVERAQRGAFLRRQLPLDLRAEQRIVDPLRPGRIPLVTPWVQDGHIRTAQRRFNIGLPRLGLPHLDRSAKEDARLAGVELRRADSARQARVMHGNRFHFHYTPLERLVAAAASHAR